MQGKPSMSEGAHLVTAEELERFPSDDSRWELVAGRIIRMTPIGFEHGRIVSQIMFLLTRHTSERGLGGVRLVVTVDPDTRTATVYRPSTPAIRLTGDDAWLELDDVVPDFRCQLRQIFEQ